MATIGIDQSTGQTFSNIDKILKDFYLGPVREQLNYSSVLMFRMKRDSESVNGRQVVIPVHIGRNEGISGVPDGGFLPDPGEQSWENLSFPVQYVYGRLLLTGPSIAAAKNDRGSFLRTLDAAIKGLTRDFKKEHNRMLHGDGSGILNADITVTGGAAPKKDFTIGYHLGTATGTSTKVGHFLRPGMKVAFIPDAKDATNKGDTTAVDAGIVKTMTGTTLTLETDLTTGLANDVFKIVRAARLASDETARIVDTSFMKEPMGLAGIVDDGDPFGSAGFQGIDSDSATVDNSWWQSTVTTGSSSGEDISFLKMAKMFDDITEAGDGAAPSLIMTDYTQRRAYYDLWNNTKDENAPGASRRFVNTMTLDGGFQAVEFNGIPLVADTDATPRAMYFLDESELAMFRNEDYFWLDRDGAILSRLDDKDAYQATLAHYAEYGTYRRNSHGLLNNLNE